MELTLRRFVVPHAQGARRILEIGPGPGTWTKLLLEVNPDASYVLVDISREMLQRAREALGERANVTYVEGDFAQLQIEGTFDVIFSSRAIEYMQDKAVVAKKIAALLAPHGSAYVVTKTPKPFLDKLIGRKLAPLHQGQVAPRALKKVFRDAGLAVSAHVATANVPAIDSPKLNAWMYHFLRFYPMTAPFTWFAESYLVTARK